MKYKNKYIQKIKDKYGVPELHFFKAWPRSQGAHKNILLHYDIYDYCFICSLDKNINKKYNKSNNDLYIESRLDHHQLENLLKVLSDNSTALNEGRQIIRKIVLLEPSGLEINDLISLKSAYLLTYLAGI
jgi:hypothetical protein